MINVVILAAGQGKRMRSSLPKVLQPLAGTPMLGHVLASVKKLESVSRTVVVVGCGAETVKSAFAQEEGLRFVLQDYIYTCRMGIHPRQPPSKKPRRVRKSPTA